ncbi:hypothetical protein PCE1_003179 [Barthelona sp. PCE]
MDFVELKTQSVDPIRFRLVTLSDCGILEEASPIVYYPMHYCDIFNNHTQNMVDVTIYSVSDASNPISHYEIDVGDLGDHIIGLNMLTLHHLAITSTWDNDIMSEVSVVDIRTNTVTDNRNAVYFSETRRHLCRTTACSQFSFDSSTGKFIVEKSQFCFKEDDVHVSILNHPNRTLTMRKTGDKLQLFMFDDDKMIFNHSFIWKQQFLCTKWEEYTNCFVLDFETPRILFISLNRIVLLKNEIFSEVVSFEKNHFFDNLKPIATVDYSKEHVTFIANSNRHIHVLKFSVTDSLQTVRFNINDVEFITDTLFMVDSNNGGQIYGNLVTNGAFFLKREFSQSFYDGSSVNLILDDCAIQHNNDLVIDVDVVDTWAFDSISGKFCVYADENVYVNGEIVGDFGLYSGSSLSIGPKHCYLWKKSEFIGFMIEGEDQFFCFPFELPESNPIVEVIVNPHLSNVIYVKYQGESIVEHYIHFLNFQEYSVNSLHLTLSQTEGVAIFCAKDKFITDCGKIFQFSSSEFDFYGKYSPLEGGNVVYKPVSTENAFLHCQPGRYKFVSFSEDGFKVESLNEQGVFDGFTACCDVIKSLQCTIDERIIDTIENHFKFTHLTAVQAAVIPELLSNKDTVVQAATGSGKTLSFIIPVLQLCLGIDKSTYSKRDTLAMIIAPTRELAEQIHDVLVPFLESLSLYSSLLTGGKSTDVDIQAIQRGGANIIVGTPGRVLELLKDRRLNTRTVETVIFDEADILFEKGLGVELSRITSLIINKQRRNGVFSATQAASKYIVPRAKMRNPIEIVVKTQQNNMVPDTLKQKLVICPFHERYKFLFDLLSSLKRKNPNGKVIVFLTTCAQVQYFYQVFSHIKSFRRLLKRGNSQKLNLFLLNGTMSANKRKENLEQFNNHSGVNLLLSTDIAARGIDFPSTDIVVQMDIPSEEDNVIHRMGRTARAGNVGESIILLSHEERDFVYYLDVSFDLSYEVEEYTATDAEFLRSISNAIRKKLLTDFSFRNRQQDAFIGWINAYSLYTNTLRISNLDMNSVFQFWILYRKPRLKKIKLRLKGSVYTDLDAWEPLQLSEAEKTKHFERSESKKRKAAVEKVEIVQKKQKVEKEIIDPKGEQEFFDDYDEIEREARLLKKLKKVLGWANPNQEGEEAEGL